MAARGVLIFEVDSLVIILVETFYSLKHFTTLVRLCISCDYMSEAKRLGKMVHSKSGNSIKSRYDVLEIINVTAHPTRHT